MPRRWMALVLMVLAVVAFAGCGGDDDDDDTDSDAPRWNMIDPEEITPQEVRRLHGIGYRGLKMIGVRRAYDDYKYFGVYQAAEERRVGGFVTGDAIVRHRGRGWHGGTEAEEQRYQLRLLGLSLGQGFLFSRAVPAHQLRGSMGQHRPREERAA